MSQFGPAPPSQDVVGVFDKNFNQVFVAARPIRARVKEGGKLAKHPVESGSTVTDNRITTPTEIQLSLVLTPEEFQDTFQQIRDNYSALTPLYVQTKAASYPNMFIEELPHEESPEMFDTISVALKLTEVIFVQAQYQQLTTAQVKDPANASTSATGQQQGADASATQTSAAYDLFLSGKP